MISASYDMITMIHVEVFDEYGNHVEDNGLISIQVDDGFRIQDNKRFGFRGWVIHSLALFSHINITKCYTS